MKFLFGDKSKTPRPDKSYIFKDHVGSSYSLIEVDLSEVKRRLQYSLIVDEHQVVDDEYVEDIVKAVAFSIWRASSWEVSENVKK